MRESPHVFNYYVMKKFIIVALIALAVATIATFVVGSKMTDSDWNEILTESVETLTRREDDGDGEYIVCRCSWVDHSECAAGNWGHKCAGGINYDCSSRDSNCG